MQPCSWEELRLEARSIENELDEKLAALGNLGKLADGGRSKGSLATGNQSHFIVSGLDTAVNYRNENPQTFSNMCSDIEQLLERLTQINDQMTDVVRKNETQSLPGSVNASSTSSSSLLVSTGSNQMTAGQLSQLHTAKRHREILRDYAQEFRQTKTKIAASREREDLLGSVYRDLANRESVGYGSGSKDHPTSSNGNTQSTATRLLLDEQEKYHRSSRLIDNHLSAASTIRSALRAQRVALRNASSGLNSLAARFPRIRQLVGKIEWRQRKDSIVLGLVIACCIAFLLIYKLS